MGIEEQMLYLFPPWALTVLLEMSAAFLLGVRGKKQLVIVCLVNTLTNPLLNLLLACLGVHFPYYAWRWAIPCLELLIWLTEGLLFRKYLKKIGHPLLFSAVLNGTSYYLGGWFLRMLKL